MTHVDQNGGKTVLSRRYHDRSVTPFSSPLSPLLRLITALVSVISNDKKRSIPLDFI